MVRVTPPQLSFREEVSHYELRALRLDDTAVRRGNYSTSNIYDTLKHYFGGFFID